MTGLLDGRQEHRPIGCQALPSVEQTFQPVRAARLAWERTQPQLFFELAVGDHEHASDAASHRRDSAVDHPSPGTVDGAPTARTT